MAEHSVTAVRALPTPAFARRAQRWLGAALAVGVAAGVWYVGFVQTPPGPRSMRVFDPARVAALELDMWQAYYARQRIRLFVDLVVMLREQYRFTWRDATVAGFHLARAAARFGDTREGYEQLLPDLTKAYAIAATWTGEGYDPSAVGRAELEWWVTRRIPGRNTAEQIGALIAREYALLYDRPIDEVEPSAELRARAARLRDDGGDAADWNAVHELLRASYVSLSDAVQPR